MDNLKIQTMMIQSSMSDIGCPNDQNDFISINYNKNTQKDRLTDYHIKINGPDFKDNSATYDEQYDRLPYSKGQSQDNIMPVSEITEYKQKITGYNIHRDAFSQQELLKTFNIIDINKDELITEDDLIFVLDYMKQQYTNEEVKQMILMLSNNKKSVNFEEFKKLGKGEIIPLAKYRMPEKNIKDKQKILENIIESQLINQEPQFLIKSLNRQSVSYNRYNEEKKAKKNPNPSGGTKKKIEFEDRLFMMIPLQLQSQYKQRNQLFMDIVLSNRNDLIYNYQQYRDKVISIQKIANILQISVKQAKQLYPNKVQVYSLLAITEAIVYSRQKISKKLQLCLSVLGDDDKINAKELIHIIQVLKGKDQSIENKIKAILQSKSMKMDQPILKNQAYEIVLEFSNKLMM